MKNMKPTVNFVNARAEGDVFFFLRLRKKRKSYLPNRCTFQFELEIPCTNTSSP